MDELVLMDKVLFFNLFNFFSGASVGTRHFQASLTVVPLAARECYSTLSVGAMAFLYSSHQVQPLLEESPDGPAP